VIAVVKADEVEPVMRQQAIRRARTGIPSISR